MRCSKTARAIDSWSLPDLLNGRRLAMSSPKAFASRRTPAGGENQTSAALECPWKNPDWDRPKKFTTKLFFIAGPDQIYCPQIYADLHRLSFLSFSQRALLESELQGS